MFDLLLVQRWVFFVRRVSLQGFASQGRSLVDRGLKIRREDSQRGRSLHQVLGEPQPAASNDPGRGVDFAASNGLRELGFGNAQEGRCSASRKWVTHWLSDFPSMDGTIPASQEV
jgi:hypothetical protein